MSKPTMDGAGFGSRCGFRNSQWGGTSAFRDSQPLNLKCRILVIPFALPSHSSWVIKGKGELLLSLHPLPA